jgi:hypothetical protein
MYFLLFLSVLPFKVHMFTLFYVLLSVVYFKPSGYTITCVDFTFILSV